MKSFQIIRPLDRSTVVQPNPDAHQIPQAPRHAVVHPHTGEVYMLTASQVAQARAAAAHVRRNGRRIK